MHLRTVAAEFNGLLSEKSVSKYSQGETDKSKVFLRPYYTMRYFTRVILFFSCFHLRYGYQNVGIQDASENTEKTGEDYPTEEHFSRV